MVADPISVTLMVVAALDRLGIPYYIGGSLASGVHGTYRAPADADIVADLREDQVDRLAGMLSDQFYADPEMMRDAIQRRASFNLLHLGTGFKVDVFIDKGGRSTVRSSNVASCDQLSLRARTTCTYRTPRA